MLSQSCKYALRAVLHLSTLPQSKRTIGVKQLAETLEVPHPYLAKILQDLSRKGLIGSAKGPHGGFFLSEAHMKGSLISVVETIDGPGFLKECILGLSGCSDLNPCPLHESFTACRKELRETFHQYAIADLAQLIKDEKLRV